MKATRVERNVSRLAARPILRSYEQVASQIRKMIENGMLARDTKLPTEAELAREFRVSRATIREGLRLLAAQDLLRTEKGRDGGSFVTFPTVQSLRESMTSTYNLLSREEITVEEFYEVRMLMEIPAARLAAERATKEQIALLFENAAYEPQPASAVNHQRNSEFHSILVEGCGNRLLCLAHSPVAHVLQKSIAHEYVTPDFRQQIKVQHCRIAEAIADRDPGAAGDEMEKHLKFLRPVYDLIPDAPGAKED